MSVKSYTQLRSLTVDELVRQYDQIAVNQSQYGLSDLIAEIARRDAEAQTAQIVQMTGDMRDMTRTMRTLTWWIAGMTFVILAATIYMAVK